MVVGTDAVILQAAMLVRELVAILNLNGAFATDASIMISACGKDCALTAQAIETKRILTRQYRMHNVVQDCSNTLLMDYLHSGERKLIWVRFYRQHGFQSLLGDTSFVETLCLGLLPSRSPLH